MPNKKYEEVKSLANEELLQQIADNKLRLQRLRFNHSVSPLENPNVLGETRKLIARLKTELRKRELSK
ncbi:MAG: 50S ribosomal protein L29 [Chitinophagales bacterium]|nr:50S ribosomal protein L29 [Chitinophagales bacterium]MCZ2392530.1 50S ribosomal protein L29 [Chitinophagales bacterium]